MRKGSVEMIFDGIFYKISLLDEEERKHIEDRPVAGPGRWDLYTLGVRNAVDDHRPCVDLCHCLQDYHKTKSHTSSRTFSVRHRKAHSCYQGPISAPRFLAVNGGDISVFNL